MRCLIVFVAELVERAQPQGGDGEGQRQEAGDGDGDGISEREEVIATAVVRLSVHAATHAMCFLSERVRTLSVRMCECYTGGV